MPAFCTSTGIDWFACYRSDGICLESNEIMELDDYPVGLLLEDLSHCPKGTGIYFYDDDSEEYYGIYPDEIRRDEKGDVWIKVR